MLGWIHGRVGFKVYGGVYGQVVEGRENALRCRVTVNLVNCLKSLPSILNLERPNSTEISNHQFLATTPKTTPLNPEP